MKLRNYRNALLSIWVLLFSVACGGSSDPDPTTPPPEAPAPDFSSSNSQVATNIGIVADSLAPLSLVDSNLGGDPCANVAFFDCQPNLLKLYIALNYQSLLTLGQVVGDLSANLAGANINPGDSGEVTDASNDTTIIYSVTDFNNYQVLFKRAVAGTPYIYFNVNAQHLELTVDLSIVSNAQDSGILKFIMDFTDAGNFDVDLTMIDRVCDSADVHGPQNISVLINRTDGVVQGKAMLYHPRFLVASNDCGLTPGNGSEMAFYTDFVGDDVNTTAAIYLLPTSVTSINEITNYAASALCTNFPSVLCDIDGKAFGDPKPASFYRNNFCVTQDSATWDMTCDSIEPKISTPIFGDIGDWIAPSDFSVLSISVPNSLQ